LSGIGCFFNAFKKKDSGQAGMTVSRCNKTFYESVKNSADIFQIYDIEHEEVL